jgi:hypothetical protein
VSDDEMPLEVRRKIADACDGPRLQAVLTEIAGLRDIVMRTLKETLQAGAKGAPPARAPPGEGGEGVRALGEYMPLFMSMSKSPNLPAAIREALEGLIREYERYMGGGSPEAGSSPEALKSLRIAKELHITSKSLAAIKRVQDLNRLVRARPGEKILPGERKILEGLDKKPRR